MSDSELKDDWTALIAKEGAALRSGQAWADLFEDDNDDSGMSNEAAEQAEGSNTVGNIENNEKPVDYLDDIDLAIPQPQISLSTPTSFHSNNEFYHPSEDSDNWRVREPKVGIESDNWRRRDPQGVKPTSFASFSKKECFDEHQSYEDRKEERRKEREENRKPENRRVDPEDAAALQKWNTFHLVVAQEELEKEKEKERLKNLYLESCKSQSTEIVKGDTNQQSCMNSSESQENPNTFQSKLDEESVSNSHTSLNEEKEPNQSQYVKTPLLQHDDDKGVSKEEQLSGKEASTSNINEKARKDGGEDLIHTEKLNKSEELKCEISPTTDDVKSKQNILEKSIQIITESIDHEEEKSDNNNDSKTGESNDKETVQTEIKESNVLSAPLEIYDDHLYKEKGDFEEKHESLNEEVSSSPKQEEFNDKTTTRNDVMPKESNPSSKKEEIASAKENIDEKETVLVSSISIEKNKETNPLCENEEADETDSEEVKKDKNGPLAQPEKIELLNNPPKDSEQPSEQPIEEPVIQNSESNQPTLSNAIELAQEQSYSQHDESLVNDVKSNNIMEEDTVKESDEEINSVKISTENQLEAATEHPISESSNSLNVLEKGDSLQEIKEEYADLEKQKLKDTKESEVSEIVGEEQEEQHENLQSGDHVSNSIQLENNESICDNVQNDNALLNESGNSTTDEALKTMTIGTTNSDSQVPIKESDQTNTTGWGEASMKEKTDWGSAIGWKQEPTEDIKQDGAEESEESTKQDEGQGWNNQVDSHEVSYKHNIASWNQEIVQDNKVGGSNGWSRVPTQQWGESSWNQSQKSDNVKSESDHSRGTEAKIHSPKVEAKKPSSGNWRDQIASSPKDDNAGGWKQFAIDQAARNVPKKTIIESLKPKKALLPKNAHNSPKLEKSWASDSTSWSKKSDITQATSSSSTQSNVSQAVSPLLSTNQQPWSSSPSVSHSNTLQSNSTTSTVNPSELSQKKEPLSSSSSVSASASASNPWAEFSALEKERSAQLQARNKQSQSQAPSQVQSQPQLQHEAIQTTPLRSSTNPPVVSISLSDFDNIFLEHKKEERQSAPIEVNMAWNGGDIIVDSPAKNPATMHVPFVVSLDDEPQHLIVTPKLEHATLASNTTCANQTHSNNSTGWSATHGSRPEPTAESSSHANRQRMPMNGSQWKMASHFLDK